MWPDSEFLFGLIGALGVLAPALGVLWRKLTGLTKTLDLFLADWQGEPPRPGVPARPGVMERLAQVEESTIQLRRNGGSHLADQIAQIRDDQVTKHERLERIEQAVASLANAQRDTAPQLAQVVATLRVGEHRFERIDRALAALNPEAAT